MTQIPLRFLPQRITLEAAKLGTGRGRSYDAPRENVPALVVDKTTMVTDQRLSSETNGREISSSCHVVMRLEDYVEPGSLVLVWKGTPRERKAEVVAAGGYEHPDAPESAQLWLA